MPDFFASEHEYIFIIPISNLDLCKRSFKMGNVRFFKFTKNHLRKYISITENILRQNVHYRSNHLIRKDIIKKTRKIYSKNVGSVCAEVKIVGKINEVYDEALMKVETAVNCLKLYRIPSDEGLRCYFGIRGEVVKNDIRIIIAYTNDKKGSRPSIENIGFLGEYRLDDIRLKFMYKNGFRILHNLLKKPNPNHLDKKIISSINWYGASFNSFSTKEKTKRSVTVNLVKLLRSGRSNLLNFSDTERFLKCMIALESFLIFDKNEPLRSSLSKRVSHIVGSDYSSKKKAYDIMKKLYDLRCEIVHGGKMHIKKEQLKLMFNSTQEIILCLLKRKAKLRINTVSDLKDWLEKQDLS